MTRRFTRVARSRSRRRVLTGMFESFSRTTGDFMLGSAEGYFRAVRDDTFCNCEFLLICGGRVSGIRAAALLSSGCLLPGERRKTPSALQGPTGVREGEQRLTVQPTTRKRSWIQTLIQVNALIQSILWVFSGHFPPRSSETVLKLTGNNVVVQQSLAA